jgi:hypothetical protein
MKDERGTYYHPFPNNKKVKMYVKAAGPAILFRLWNGDDPQMWEKHGWVEYEAIMQASTMYNKGGDFNPDVAYDLDVARMVIAESKEN